MWASISIFVVAILVLSYICGRQQRLLNVLREKLTELQHVQVRLASENHAVKEVLKDQGFQVYTSTVDLGDMDQITVKVVRIDVDNGSVH